jgi:hypothetical protein
MLALTVFADSIYGAVRNPDLGNFAWVAVVAVAIGVAIFSIRRWRRKRERDIAPAAEG